MMRKESSKPRLGHRERLRRREVLREVDGGVILTEDTQGVDLTTTRMTVATTSQQPKKPGLFFLQQSRSLENGMSSA